MISPVSLPHWTPEPHHNRLSACAPNPYLELDEDVTVTLCAPLDAPFEAVFLRSEPDGEAKGFGAWRVSIR